MTRVCFECGWEYDGRHDCPIRATCERCNEWRRFVPIGEYEASSDE